MIRKMYLSKSIQVWGIVLIIGLGIIFGLINIVNSQRSFNVRSNQLRAEMYEQQKMLIQQEVVQVIEHIKHTRDESERLTKEKIQSRVEEAHSIAQNLYIKFKDSQNPSEIRKMIVEALASINYENGLGYYFIDSIDGHSVLFGNREVDGTYILDLQDPDGKYLIKDLITIATEQGHGFYSYRWSKPDKEDVFYDKISYIKLFEPYGWSIGTGLYEIDIEEKTQKKLLHDIGEIRFGDRRDGYVFVDSYDGVFLQNVSNELIGQNYWNTTNSDGVLIMQEFRKAAGKPEGDFIYYNWEKPSTNKIVPKVTYIKGIDDWGWMIGAGFYVDDVSADILILQNVLRREVVTGMIYSFLLTVGVVVIFIFIFGYIRQKVLNDFNQFIFFFQNASDSYKEIDCSILHFLELEYLAENANKMIHARKLMSEEVLYLRTYFSNIINSMPSVLIGIDNDFTVTLWNEAAEQYTGISTSDAMSRNLFQFFPEIKSEIENLKKSMDKLEIVINRNHSRKLGNQHYFEDIVIYPIVTNRKIGAVIRIDDITLKYKMEELMIQNEKMLSLGGMAAGMAHEINNPLAGMMQTASVLSRRLNSAENIPFNIKAAEEVGTTVDVITSYMERRNIFQMLDGITESGKRIADIVTNMLSFARKSDGRFLLENPIELLDHAIELAINDYDYKNDYDFKAIAIKKEYAEDLPLIPCDRSKIQQVLLNLLRNGAQAMVESHRDEPLFVLHLRNQRGVKELVIEIEDNGPGMDEDTRRRIFEPFFTTKPVGIGTGLGLSVSYFIITEHHKGTMSVESKVGRGTNVIITLPY